MIMQFNYQEFLTVFSGKTYIFNQVFTPLRTIDPVEMYKIAKSCKKFGVKRALTSLRSRLSEDYYYKMYPAQCASMSYSRTAFPPYRFILPDVLTEDWLALVDYHKDFSRDHCIHQPLSAYIVHALLGGGNAAKALTINGQSILDRAVDTLIKGNKTGYLREYFKQYIPHGKLFSGDAIAKQLWKDLFYETAITAALFHDTGYPWQYVGRLKGSIGKNDFNLPVEDLNADHIYRTFKSRLVMYPFHAYSNPLYNSPAGWDRQIHCMIKDAIAKTHGFPGALGYLYLNDLVRKSPSPQGEEMAILCIDWAALGIMMHDMVKIYQGGSKEAPKYSFLRIDFEQDPLSCIIALADVLEDFYRPTAFFSPDIDSDKGVKVTYDIASYSTELDVNGSEMTIIYHFGSDSLANAQRGFKEQEIKEYFDPAVGYIDISSLGLSKVKCYCVV